MVHDGVSGFRRCHYEGCRAARWRSKGGLHTIGAVGFAAREPSLWACGTGMSHDIT